jgi:cytochrome b561
MAKRSFYEWCSSTQVPPYSRVDDNSLRLLRRAALSENPGCGLGFLLVILENSVRMETLTMTEQAVSPSIADAHWRYGPPAVVLHWLVAILIVGLLGLGWYMMSIEKQPGSDWYFNLHRSLGLTLAGLVVLRIIWRMSHRPEELPASVPPWEKTLSLAAHWLLYACMVVMPLTGYLGSAYNKSGVAFFGLALPFWAANSRELSKLFFTIHEALVWVLVAAVVLHALAGLKHLLVDKDRVFQRMWF